MSRSVLLEGLAWAATATIGLVALSQALGTTALPILYVLQAFTIHAGVISLGLAIASGVLGRPLLAVVNALVVVAVVWLAVPVLAWQLGGTRPIAAAGASTITVLQANTYYGNDRVEEAADVLTAAAAEHDVDVIVITEYSDELEAELTSRLGDRYPFAVGEASDERNGLGLLSRLPLTDVVFGPYRTMPGLEVTIGVTELRIIGVHPVPGVEGEDLDRWHIDLDHIGDRATSPGPPTVVVGDFNASRWHPPFRDLLDRGLTDVHERLGHGFSGSWPVSWWRPRFVRLDHALVDDRVTPLSVVDFHIPGSDHTGFVVQLAAGPAAVVPSD